MHGGIGMTDEHDAGLYLKRARAAEMTFGDAAWHRDRWGTAARLLSVTQESANRANLRFADKV